MGSGKEWGRKRAISVIGLRGDGFHCSSHSINLTVVSQRVCETSTVLHRYTLHALEDFTTYSILAIGL